MKLVNYMPNLYKKNIEMTNIINSEEVETENLKEKTEIEFNNTFITTSNAEGISKMERILNISSDNSISLEDRRQIVQNKISLDPPFTEKTLINYLDNILGKGNWSYTIDYNNYTLTINSTMPGQLWYNELFQYLEKVVPVNIDWSVQIFEASWNAVNENFDTWQDVLNMTWQDVLNGEWLN